MIAEQAPRSLKATLLKVKARVPVYRLFVTIFLWFWITAWSMLAMVLLVNYLKGIRQVSQPSLYATIAPVLAAEAARTYESGGKEAFARFSQSATRRERQLFLLDGFYKDVLAGTLTEDGLKVARAARFGQLMMLHDRIAAYRFVSSTGHPYILLLYLERPVSGKVVEALKGTNLAYSVSVFLLVTMLCFALAYHIASPIQSIQSTARKVAQGDLSARVPAAISKRFDELSFLAQDFDRMVSRLELMIRTQRNLLGSVSHELRSPLARISLTVALLRKGSSGPSDELCDRLERDVSRIDTLMTQLLQLFRLEAGLSSAQKEDVDLAQVVDEVIADSDFEARAFGKSVNLAENGQRIPIHADPHALRSACENVIRNAVRFTPAGTGVEVSLRVDPAGIPASALITIRDFGPGVPEDALEAIFEPFYRIRGDRHLQEGNGLGLAIASEAIRQHQGAIRAANCRPSGLEVTIRLPVGPLAATRPG